MKRLLNALRVKSEHHQLFDIVLALIEKQELDSMKMISCDTYMAGDATVTVKYFDDGAFEEVQISLGYAVGKGVTVVLRNYIEHLVVINHEILDTYHTVEFPIRTDAFALQDYRTKFDLLAERVVSIIDNMGHVTDTDNLPSGEASREYSR